MPPIRRYLRITPHSVLEVRIYLDNPADAHRWLLHPRTPTLLRVIEAVRPLILPKLREENANARAKGGKGKRKGWKDVVGRDDFEVAVFLTETSMRHSILRKEKIVRGGKRRLGSLGGKMTGTRDEPVDVGDDGPGILREESEGKEVVRIADLPVGGSDVGEGVAGKSTEDGEELFVSEGGSGDDDMGKRLDGKRKKLDADDEGGEGGEDDKKKLALDTSYDGFSIYGRILCLVVKRKGSVKGKEAGGGTGQAMMEDWIASTQMGDGQMMAE